MNLFDCTFPLLKIDKPIRLIELFAGIGAQAKALETLGVPFEHYRICEFDKYAVASYNAVHGTDFETSDITQIHASDLAVTETEKYCYMLTYSFPCQDLSNAGKQRGMTRGGGTRSGLLWEVERLLNEMDELPQILVMENVPAVVGEKNKADFMEWVHFLQSKGYTCKWDILNAKDYGIPQNRERCFMVSYLGDYLYEFPQGFPLKLRLRDVLEDEVDEKYYIKGEAADRLCSQLLKVEREREREASKAVRAGGRGSLDKHEWDIITEQAERGREPKARKEDSAKRAGNISDRNKCGASINGLQRASKDCYGGVYLQATENYQRGVLPGLARTIKAVQHDAGVILNE